MTPRYVTPEEYAAMDTVTRASLQAMALITCDRFNQRGEDVRILTFLPTRQVFMKVGDRMLSRYTQEEFAEKRRQAIQSLGDLISEMNGPTKGKGALLKRKAAGRRFCELAGYTEVEE